MVDFESRSPVGSSNSIIAGEFANDLAMALSITTLTLFVARPPTTNSADGLLFLTAPLF